MLRDKREAAQLSETLGRTHSPLVTSSISGMWVCVWNWWGGALLIQQAYSSRGIIISSPRCQDFLPLTVSRESKVGIIFCECPDVHRGGTEAHLEAFAHFWSPEPGFSLRGIWANCYRISHCVNGRFGQVWLNGLVFYKNKSTFFFLKWKKFNLILNPALLT